MTECRSELGGRTGLDVAEAERRLQRDGPNRLPAARPVPAWRVLSRQFTHFFAVMLWVAGGLAVAGGLPQLGLAIFVVIVVNGVFAYAQEARAEHAAESLRRLLPTKATVVRSGERRTIDASELVVGDVVMLAGGDRVSADLRYLEGGGLSIDRSTFTGESVPEEVDVGGELSAGTFVVQGEATAEVVATGSNTRLAAIATLVEHTVRPQTPLTIELHRLVRTIATIASLVGVSFFGLSMLLGTSLSDGFIFAVGVTVALVPEGLLPTVTLSLGIGAQRMAAQHALVRRLEAVETLGSTTFICTDKTGTLTQNQMSVAEVWTPHGRASVSGVGYDPVATVTVDAAARPAVERAALVALTCSSGRAVDLDGTWLADGDPMDAAIDALTRRLGLPDADRDQARSPDARFPFDPHRRRASAIYHGDLFVKGASDAVVPLLQSAGTEVSAVVDDMAGRGLRVIALATRRLRVDGTAAEIVDETAPRDPLTLERDLELVGLLGLHDPPRPGAADAVAACRAAGIRLAMVTGDHPGTAAAIADAVGLRQPGAPVITGDALPDDDEVLGALIDRDGVVLARIDPETKLRIARALRARGHVVAMTGDGVNDGPALREADIGVAMGASGTDVARDAADLVLLDDHFGTIVTAVRQGRATYANARQFLTYHLTDNVAELTPFVLWAVTGGRFPLALGVLQILALDLGTDTLSAAALGAEPADDRVLAGPPASGRLLDRTTAVRAFGVLGPTEAAFEMGAFLLVIALAGWRPGSSITTDAAVLAGASGAAFLTVVVAQTANAFACRSRAHPAWALPLRHNWLLVGAAVAELAFAFVCLALPAATRLLDHQFPPAAAWVIILASAPAMLAIDALVKRHAGTSDPCPSAGIAGSWDQDDAAGRTAP